MKYIAYGSNMVKSEMASRCPDAKLIGTGYLLGHSLEFYCFATVEPGRNRKAKVPVAVWEISERDEQSLNTYEGWPTYYSKETRTVQMLDGSRVEGLIYTLNSKEPIPVVERYYKRIVTAYIDMGFSAEVKTILAPARKRSESRRDKARAMRP